MNPSELRCAVAPSFVEIFREHAGNSLFDQLVAMCGGTLMVDREARIAWMDDKYMAAFGVTPEVIGRPIEAVVPTTRMREVIDTGKPIFLDLIEVRGKPPVVCIRLPLKDVEGHMHGAVAFMLFDRHQYLQPLMAKVASLQQELASARERLAGERQAKYSFSQLMGNSPPIREVKRLGRRAAQYDTTVLLLGETGTGKELLAHAIHHASARAHRPFVSVNVAAIPEALLEAEFFGAAPGAYTGADRRGREGKFLLANGGTIFLDEIGDMPLSVQPKLLRALQEREIEPLGSNRVSRIDVRVLAATSRDLEALVREGKFRADLYYRLDVLPITLPPLRERGDDLPLICESLLERIAARFGLPPQELEPRALARLAGHDWPGNVRELANVLERLVMSVDGHSISEEDVAAVLPQGRSAMAQEERGTWPIASAVRPTIGGSEPPRSGGATLAEREREAILEALTRTRGVKAAAARLLGISRTTLYEKLESYGLAGQDNP